MGTPLTNWGNYPVIPDADLRSANHEKQVKKLIENWDHYIPRGLGRCYGDSALGENVLSSLSLDRVLAFDEKSGLITCQAGVSFETLIDTFLPRGWFLPVTPGTKFITVGGAIAADIHGKNHHSEGSFSNHLLGFRLLLPEGEVLYCSREENADLFWATCGGMGLTGFILEASFRMKAVETSYIVQESMKARNLDEAFKLFEDNLDWTYSVAWLDCLAKGKKLGRSILLVGEHATREDLRGTKYEKDPLKVAGKGKLFVPFFLPKFVISDFNMRLFNILYYAKTPFKRKRSIVSYDPYYYPLDGILHWNRVYGKRGFLQYQFVIPPKHGYEGLKAIIQKISDRGFGSFLTVLKWFGKQEGMLSFPREGWTLALDFPAKPSLFPFLNELDELVLKYDGRIYLTKDARMNPEMFRQGYGRWEEFEAIRKKVDPNGRMQSLQSKRLEV